MSYPNSQGNSASAIPVYIVAQPGAGPYPNLQSNAGGAIPIYEVAGPGTAPEQPVQSWRRYPCARCERTDRQRAFPE
jgi:hypothetical protein